MNAPGTEQRIQQMDALLEQVFSEEAQDFLTELHQRFNSRRLQLLVERKRRQEGMKDKLSFDFLPHTKAIREAQWTVAPLPKDLIDRRVEITGPVDRKMIINALNSGAKVFMADFEDSNSPTYANLIDGQLNLMHAIRRSLHFTDKKSGKEYKLVDQPATLMVRPRGWHLDEKHFTVHDEFTSASLFDFGLFFFNNAKELIARGSGPYFYLPKMESHLEAQLWNDVFVFAQDYLNITQGTIKATVLIETLPAAFEMDEILYELRNHSAGLNCGRWDYIFSFIKKTGHIPGFVLPDRAQIGMTQPFMEAYCQLLVDTCHKRGVHAMGGMAAQIPIKGDEAANNAAMLKVRNDKLREVKLGHDGTWVAHPALIPIVLEVFNEHMPQANQLDRRPDVSHISANSLLQVPSGTISEEGIIHNIDVALQYIEAWLSGKGCVPIYNLMEDAATAEISRTQLWQWLHADNLQTSNAQTIDQPYMEACFAKGILKTRMCVGEEYYASGRFDTAEALLHKLVFRKECPDFLTTEAYRYL